MSSFRTLQLPLGANRIWTEWCNVERDLCLGLAGGSRPIEPNSSSYRRRYIASVFRVLLYVMLFFVVGRISCKYYVVQNSRGDITQRGDNTLQVTAQRLYVDFDTYGAVLQLIPEAHNISTD